MVRILGVCLTIFFNLKKGFNYLFFREKGREKERERNIDWLPLTGPQWGTWPSPRHWSWPGIKLATFQLAGWCLSTEPHQPGLY